MKESIRIARQMARLAAMTHDALMWTAAHNMARRCLS